MIPQSIFPVSCSLAFLLSLSPPSTAADTNSCFRFDFENDNPTQAWTGATGTLAEGHHGGHSLQLDNPDPSGSAVCSIALPADQLDGQMVSISAMIRAENVSPPPQHWNGIKVMLVLQMGDATDHPQLRIGSGSFPWTEVEEVIRLPKGITKARLVLGLEKSSGTAWFDNVRVRAGRPQRTGKRSDVMFKGHDLPRLRGVMIGPEFNGEDIRVLAEEWQANHVRWQLNWTPMKRAEEWARDLDEYDKWLAGALDHMDKALDAFDRHDIKVLVDLHTPPGGRAEGGVCRMFKEERYQKKLLEAWELIARRCKGHRCVYAFDLINEPVEPGWGAKVAWPELATRAIDVIRSITPGMPVVYEPGPWGTADGFDHITPLERERVIYSFHMYQPHKFTHQGLHDDKPFTYPGEIEGIMWNKARLDEAMVAAIEFQQAYNVHIYVGEFSAIRWAPDNSAHRYLRDCIDLFESHGWDWAYHAYREFNGWSVEHGTNRTDSTPAPQQTEREKLLRGWFEKNQRPPQGGATGVERKYAE